MEIVQVDSSTCLRKYNILLETKSLKTNLIFFFFSRETYVSTKARNKSTFEKFH